VYDMLNHMFLFIISLPISDVHTKNSILLKNNRMTKIRVNWQSYSNCSFKCEMPVLILPSEGLLIKNKIHFKRMLIFQKSGNFIKYPSYCRV